MGAAFLITTAAKDPSIPILVLCGLIHPAYYHLYYSSHACMAAHIRTYATHSTIL